MTGSLHSGFDVINSNCTIWTMRSRCAAAAGVILAIMGTLLGVLSPRDGMQVWPAWGVDFATLYICGEGILRGENIYDTQVQQEAFTRALGTAPTWGVFYPPSSAVVIAPLSLLPFRMACWSFYGLCVGTLLAGTWLSLAAFAARLSFSRRLLIVGLVICSCSTRWGLILLQSAPLLLGLLGIYLAATARHRRWVAFTAQFLTLCLKVTFGLPFVAISMLQRDFLRIALALTLFVLVNAAGFWRMGGMTALNDYRENMKRMEMRGTINSPDPWEAQTTARTDLAVLINVVHGNIKGTYLVVAGLTGLSLLWLTWQAFRIGPYHSRPATVIVFLGPLVALSMLCVYHHLYDAVLLLAPAIMYAFASVEVRRLPGVMWFLTPITIYAVTYFPSVLKLLTENSSPIAYALLYKTFGPICVVVAFIASLVTLHRYVELTRADGNGLTTQTGNAVA